MCPLHEQTYSLSDRKKVLREVWRRLAKRVSSLLLFCFVEHSVCVCVCFLSLKGVQPVEILQAFIPVANRHPI